MYGQKSGIMLTKDNIDYVIDQMQKLSILRKIEAKTDSSARFKARVDDEAVETLKSVTLPIDVDDLAQYKYIRAEPKSPRARNYEAQVRPTIITRIKEILTRPDHTTSDYAAASPEMKDRINSYAQLTKVPHIGVAYAGKLYDAGIRSIEDLQRNSSNLLQEHTITAAQQQGAALYQSGMGKAYAGPEGKFARAEADAYKDQLDQVIMRFNQEHGLELAFMITGSYRRGAQYIGDIDILMTEDKGRLNATVQQQFLQRIQEYGLLTAITEMGHIKVAGYCDTSRFIMNGGMRRVDFEFVYDNWNIAAELLYFTGDLNFNTEMRRRAKNMGYHLTNDGLYRLNADGSVGERIMIASERDIFNALGMQYVEPSARSGKKMMF